jgi:glycosyltransferase involved in cell wall biosynthesis
MQVSWLLDKKVDFWQSYIEDTFTNYKNTYGNIRIDLFSGEEKYENKIPNKFKSKYLSIIFSKTDYENYYNYIWLKKNKVDILHLKRSYLFPSILTLLKKSNRPKIIITLRGSDTYLWPWVSEKWKEFYSNKGYGIDAFIVQSRDQKEYAIKMGLPDQKISIIPASISKKKDIFIPKTIKKNKKVRIISIYRFTWQKNIQGNLLFIKKLRQSIPNIEYNIYGKGDNLNSSQIYYLADRLGISDVINIKGTLSNDEMRKEMISNNYILQLSLSEASGLALMEAMQQGLVPIVSKIGGIQDIVENNVTGIIEDYYKIDKILSSFLKLNKNPLKYSLMSEACSKFIDEKFDNSIESEKLYSLYKKLIQ